MGQPSSFDVQSQRDGPTAAHSRPGTEWVYNDVRVNLLCLALTMLLGCSLEDVLRETIMQPIGASDTWRWHGYADSSLNDVPVVVGGAHWGGGLFISAHDLAQIGELCRNHGHWQGTQLISRSWITRQWKPCPIKPDYGYLWWAEHRPHRVSAFISRENRPVRPGVSWLWERVLDTRREGACACVRAGAVTAGGSEDARPFADDPRPGRAG
jgi:CubicO group peptidase (beta-lactamase class C family)